MEKSKKKINKNSYKYKYDRDHEKVKGKFHFYEVQGGSMSFSVKAYKEDQVETFTMRDGEIYTVPKFVAKHLNVNGWYPEHGYKMDMNGKPMMGIQRKVQRFGFESLEFINLADEDSLDTMGPSVIEEVVTMQQTSLK